MDSRPDTLLEQLDALAHNLWWSWQPGIQAIFRELDPVRYRELRHNPVALLAEIPHDRLLQQASESSLRGRVAYHHRRLTEYLKNERTWGTTHAGVLRSRPVAYFSAEFGLHESLPIYSGGLGVLAGDHLKSASDLGIPMVGIGLFYGQGYFVQSVDGSGWQQETYPFTDTTGLPVEIAKDDRGQQIEISIQTRGGTMRARVWKVPVGRVTLLLLDSDVAGNSEEDRRLTYRLYGGDSRNRIRQELLIGVGGVRALAALGITPGVLHLNEGHSAFASLEMTRQRMHEEGVTFDEAARRVATQTVFTTHTPVPAGHDRFSAEQIEEHLGPVREELGISAERLMGIGRETPSDTTETFCMTVIALKSSHRANGVSSLHGQVSRRMWNTLWPDRREQDVPIGHITNGVHVFSWLAPQMEALYDRHFAPDWRAKTGHPELWEAIENVDDGELWETHLSLKLELIEFVRRNASAQARIRGESAEIVSSLENALDPEALLIGFARRFATYKRANLILQDLERLARLVHHVDRPIQLVFAGKSHPMDEGGKRLIQGIHEVTRDPRFRGKVVFIENYDMNVGRHLVQGVDVWLNNPRRPLEASGTSGEKVVLNGGLNCSILDGWWAEAYDGSNGFAIGTGLTHEKVELQDKRDSVDLFKTLDHEVIPTFYKRDENGLRREWIARMKRSIRTLGWRFNADRMVMDYVRECYVPAAGGLSREMKYR